MKTVLEIEDLANQAIKAALSQKWEEAVRLNQEILADDPRNIEASNRLARAYQELGQQEQAKQTYQAVLTLDPYNTIAQKNLERLGQGKQQTTSVVSQEVFVEEPGKTRAVTLTQANMERLGQLVTGTALELERRNGRLAILTPQGKLLGYIDDALSAHLLNLIHLGNKYTAHLMTASESPQVFLREIEQSSQAAKFVSFPRTHGGNAIPSSAKDGMAQDQSLSLDANSSDEDLEGWDNDGLSDESADLDLHDEDMSGTGDDMAGDEDDYHHPSLRDDY